MIKPTNHQEEDMNIVTFPQVTRLAAASSKKVRGKGHTVTQGSFIKLGHKNNDRKLNEDGQVRGGGEHVQLVQEEMDGVPSPVSDEKKVKTSGAEQSHTQTLL